MREVIVEFSEDEYKLLEEMAKEEGITVIELVQKAADEYLENQKKLRGMS